MSPASRDLEALHPGHAQAREELLDLAAGLGDSGSSCDARQEVLLHGPAGVGKHHLATALASLLPQGVVHLQNSDDPHPLPDAGLVIWIGRTRTRPAAATHRLRSIYLRGYSPHEKRSLARSHIVPSLCTHYGLPEALFDDDTLLSSLLLAGPRETGWHGFVERLSRLCRRRRREGSSAIDHAWLESVLGADLHPFDPLPQQLPPGSVHAMMSSSWGGDLARVEAQALPGKGRLTVTGAGSQVEMVARVARTRLHVLAPCLKMPLEALRDLDWHLHIGGPPGPKDGVSLGWPLLVAMVSHLSSLPVDAQTAFTGELSLSGSILGVGDALEKALGAARAGIGRASLPIADTGEFQEIAPALLGTQPWFVSQDSLALAELELWRQA